MNTKAFFKNLFLLLASCLIAIPVAIMAAIALVPLWRWIEVNLSIESIGHSGPAGWCYLLCYGITISSICFGWWFFSHSKNAKQQPDRPRQ